MADQKGLPWPEALKDAWKLVQKAVQGRADLGLYEVLKYESTLELKDGGGKRATCQGKGEFDI